MQISVTEFLRLIVRRQVLAYQARFGVKETGMGKKGVCKEDSCSWESWGCQVVREEASIKKWNRAAVVFWRSQRFLERSMWDRWPSPTLLKGRKLQRISPGRQIIWEQSRGFYVIWCMEGSVRWIWLWKNCIQPLLLPFLLGSLRKAEGLSEVCPPCWFAPPVCREESFLAGWYGSIAWGQGKETVLSVSLPSLLQRNFTERCVLPISHQTPCSYLLYQKSCEEKALLVQAGASPSLPPSRDASQRPLMWDSQHDPRLSWSMVPRGLNVGWVSPMAPIGNELECFILVSDTFLSKHPWVPLMCN